MNKLVPKDACCTHWDRRPPTTASKTSEHASERSWRRRRALQDGTRKCATQGLWSPTPLSSVVHTAPMRQAPRRRTGLSIGARDERANAPCATEDAPSRHCAPQARERNCSRDARRVCCHTGCASLNPQQCFYSELPTVRVMCFLWPPGRGLNGSGPSEPNSPQVKTPGDSARTSQQAPLPTCRNSGGTLDETAKWSKRTGCRLNRGAMRVVLQLGTGSGGSGGGGGTQGGWLACATCCGAQGGGTSESGAGVQGSSTR